MVDWLFAQAWQPDKVAVAIETPHGPVVEALTDRGIAVFAINPKQLDRFRDRFSPAGVKDDRRDALVLASSLRTDRHCFRRVEAMDPAVVEPCEWSRMAEQLKGERVRLANRIRQQPWRYYPQALDFADDIGADWVLALWAKAPTPTDASHLTEKKVARMLTAHRIRRITAADAQAILQRPPLTVAPGTVETVKAHITATAERLNLVKGQIKDVTRRLDALVEQLADPEPKPGQAAEQRDAAILRSLPGVGKGRPRHAAQGGPSAHPRPGLSRLANPDRGRTRHQTQRQVAWVEMRQACSNRLPTAVYHWARVATQYDAPSRTRYVALRARGHSNGRALRTVADRLLRIAGVMLENRNSYDPKHEAPRDAQTA